MSAKMLDDLRVCSALACRESRGGFVPGTDGNSTVAHARRVHCQTGKQPTTEGRDMDTARITEILTDPVTLDLVGKQPIMQIAYAAADGSPRAVPIGYLLREGTFVFFTIPGSD